MVILRHIHLRRHEGVKPYVCSECPKRFCTAAELKAHQLSHSNYKQFAVVHVVNISDINLLLNATSRDVLISWE